MPRVASEAASRIGARIGEVRRSAGLTQDELAAATGIDSSNLRAYEAGRAMPSVQTVVRIAVALAVRPGELIDDVPLEAFHRPRSAAG